MEMVEESFDPFGVVERAALQAFGQPDLGAFLLTCREQMKRLLIEREIEPPAAARIAQKLAEAIALRAHEIQLAAGSNMTGSIQ